MVSFSEQLLVLVIAEAFLDVGCIHIESLPNQFNRPGLNYIKVSFVIRRFDEAIDPKQKYTPRPGVYAVLVRENRLLITFQAQPQPEYQLPGGGIDPGESVLAALHREVREETGWSVSVNRRLGAFQRYTYMPEYDMWAHKICHIYLCRPARRLGMPLEAHHSALWVSFSEAGEILANTGDRFFVRNLRG